MKTISAIIVIFILGLWFGTATQNKPEINRTELLKSSEEKILQKEIYCLKLENEIKKRQELIDKKISQ